MMRRPRLAGAVVAAVLSAPLAAAPAGAQSSLGVQGFGYPTGQLSTRALGTGGALADFDPVSPINPTALLEFNRTFAAFQYDPEFRRLEAGQATQRNTISRFPVVAVGAPLRRRLMLGLSASTLLDRSFTAQFRTTTTFPDQTVEATERTESTGSIADVRLAGAYAVNRWLRVGAGAHVLSGENRLVSAYRFDDTVRFRNVSDSSTVGYSGTAASLGVDVAPVRGVRLAGTYRRGAALRASRNDTTLTSGRAPDRAGLSLRVDRVTGAAIALAWSRTAWSRMRGLGTSALDVRDADEFAAGVEAAGPRVGDFPVLLRLGGRRRTLPFGVGGAQIREIGYGGGAGLPLGGGRALVDVAAQRTVRTPDGGNAAVRDARERAWTLSVGFTVRP